MTTAFRWPATLKQAAEVADGETPPVIATDHELLLKSDDPVIERNKRFCYDMYRTVLQAGRADKVRDYIAEDYIQHNPNALSGATALEEFIRNSRPERPVEAAIALPLISIIAERDMVAFMFVRKEAPADGEVYYTSWFDIFRIENGMIVEHWDPALRSAEMSRIDPNQKRLS